jgi:hypothetical protein
VTKYAYAAATETELAQIRELRREKREARRAIKEAQFRVADAVAVLRALEARDEALRQRIGVSRDLYRRYGRGASGKRALPE